MAVPDPDVFVQLDLTVDEQQLVDDAIDDLRAAWPGWEPNDGNLDVVILEKGASFVSSLAYIAAQMPAAALEAFATKLYGVQYGQGSPAGTTVTIRVMDGAGYTIPQGAQFEIDGYAFAVYQDTDVPENEVQVTGVQVYCATNTADANNLPGTLVAQLSLPAYVTGITVEAPTDGGADPQTMSDFLSAFSAELQLRAKSIVTTRDYEVEALNFSPEIGRAQAIGNAARQVTVTVATVNGEVVSAPTKAALAAHYSLFSLVNDVPTIDDPTYTTINVTWSVDMIPGGAFDPTDLESRINGMLTQNLSPATFGQPSSGDPGSGQVTGGSGWIADPTVRVNDIIGWIGSIPGVLHVLSVEINGAVQDVAMPGTAPLPEPGVMTGTVS